MKSHHALPAFLKRYFWDVAFRQMDRDRSRPLIIERILEYGDPKAVRWLREHVEAMAIREVLQQSPNLSARSANFWARRYRVDHRRVRCLSRSFQRRRARHWFV